MLVPAVLGTSALSSEHAQADKHTITQYTLARATTTVTI